MLLDLLSMVFARNVIKVVLINKKMQALRLLGTSEAWDESTNIKDWT